jgi:hypothetical protein
MAAMRTRYVVALLATVATAAVSTTFSTPAQADTHGDAVKAFEEGRKLRETDVEKAARAFERSILLEPSIGAYYNLGQVNEQLNRPREAVEAFRKAEKLAIQKGDPRNADAQGAWGKILDTRNYVIVNVSDEVKATPGLVVLLDGVPVPESQFNGEVFRPTATHEVVVSAAAHKDLRLAAVPNKQPVTILLGESSGPLTPPPPPPPETSGGGWGWQKWTGTGLMAVGVGGVAYTLINVFSYVGKESGRFDTAKMFHDNCTGNPATGSFTKCSNGLNPADGRGAYAAYNANEQDAKDSAPVWIVVGAAGVLLIGGGLYLFATAPSSSTEPPPPSGTMRVHVIPQVGIHDNGLSVVGTF